MQGSKELVDASVNVHDVVTTSAAKTTLAVSGAVYTYFGLPLSDWVAILTILFLILQIIAISPRVLAAIRTHLKGVKQWLQRKNS